MTPSKPPELPAAAEATTHNLSSWRIREASPSKESETPLHPVRLPFRASLAHLSPKRKITLQHLVGESSRCLLYGNLRNPTQRTALMQLSLLCHCLPAQSKPHRLPTTKWSTC